MAYTALKKYQKLECSGLWRESVADQRREVIANLGATSLILSDPRRETALTHWSLPAVKRLNPGEMPALYAPDAADGETLEIDDMEMISALETVHSAIRAASPHPGRLRNVVLGVTAVCVVAMGIFWLPEAMEEHTASFLPRTTRVDIGKKVLADLTRLTGKPCGSPSGVAALAKLSSRVFGADSGVELIVVRTALSRAQALPGRIIVLPESLLAEQDGPEVAAGVALATRIYSEMNDPLIPLLGYAGLGSTFRLLTTGVLPDTAIAGYGDVLVKAEAVQPDTDILLTRFESIGLATTPYATNSPPNGTATADLIDADPFKNVIPPALLPDGDWIGLQDICTE
jgi:hypothetical protein